MPQVGIKTPVSVLLALAFLLPASLLGAQTPEIVKTVCAKCHGIDGNSIDPAIPKLAGMELEYLMRQLRAFAAGKRRDESMSSVIASIESRDFVGLALYYGAQQPTPGKVQDQKLAAKGKVLFEEGNAESGLPACARCHQPDGKGNARFPRLAGQHQTYVITQLSNYKSGRRATDPLMTDVGQRLTSNEIKAVAEYVAGL